MGEFNLGLRHEDARGKIYDLVASDRLFELIECKKNAPRGGHYHENQSILVVLHGALDYSEFDLEKGESSEVRKVISKGDVVRIGPRAVHMIVAKEDSLLIEWVDGKHEAVNYPPWRKKVGDFLARNR